MEKTIAQQIETKREEVKELWLEIQSKLHFIESKFSKFSKIGVIKDKELLWAFEHYAVDCSSIGYEEAVGTFLAAIKHLCNNHGYKIDRKNENGDTHSGMQEYILKHLGIAEG